MSEMNQNKSRKKPCIFNVHTSLKIDGGKSYNREGCLGLFNSFTKVNNTTLLGLYNSAFEHVRSLAVDIEFI